jgi:hypothetical protein
MQSGTQAFVTWTLHMNHPRLSKGRPIAVEGCSCLTFASDGRIVIRENDRTLAFGTGKPGLMRPHAALVADLQEKGITAMVMPSKQAAEKYNALDTRSAVS